MLGWVGAVGEAVDSVTDTYMYSVCMCALITVSSLLLGIPELVPPRVSIKVTSMAGTI